MINTNYKFGEVHRLADQIEAGSDHVNFQNIINTANGGVALIAFKAGQKLDQHVAPAELMVTVIEGEIEFKINDTPHTLHAGEFILVGEGVPHSVNANTNSKVVLTKMKA
ncbi:MAG: cupin domain-containing protein [Muribaculaceae bacterium]|nr:cupin domain-containing protein [Muribaculaceae bacterium]